MSAPTTLASPPTEEIAAYIADAYRDASLAGASMETATPALEEIRRSLGRERSVFTLWNTADDAIGRAGAGALQTVLVTLRDRIAAEIVRRLGEGFQSAFASGRRDVVDDWRATFAEALDEGRFDLCGALCDAVPDGSEIDSLTSGDFARWTRLAEMGRFGDALPMYEYLAKAAELPTTIRAAHLVNCAMIELYHMWRQQRALEWLDQANEVEPDCEQVLAGFGQYWIEKGKPDAAKGFLERARAADPASASGYVYASDVSLAEAAFDDCEGWLRECLAQVPRSAEARRRLILLYGRPELFAEHESHLKPLVEQLVRAAPAEAYYGYVAVATAYASNERMDEAMQMFDRAIELDPDRILAFTELGYAESQQKQYEQAEATVRRAIDVAPDAVEGYWAMAQVFDQGNEFDSALRWYEEVLARRASWEPLVRSRIADIYDREGKAEEAEREFAAALRIDPANEGSVGAMETFAVSRGQKGDRAAAARVFTQIREIVGDRYEAPLHNRLGNLHYEAGEYDAAFSEYRQAVDADDDNPLYRRNCASALLRLGRWEDARAAYETAFAIDEDRAEHDSNVAFALNEEATALFTVDLTRSIDLYQQAVDLVPSDKTYRTNLYQAWFAHWPPGDRATALDNAIDVIERAAELHPDDAKLPHLANYVRLERYLVERLGEPPPGHTQSLAIELAEDLVTSILTPGADDLSPETQGAIAGMKERFDERWQTTLPGIRFRRPGEDGGLPPGHYTLFLVGSPAGSGSVPADGQTASGNGGSNTPSPVPEPPIAHPLNHLAAALAEFAQELADRQTSSSPETMSDSQ
jgi:tetratricopeptide (TPR) repeat protein